jgi:hypothetical protein
MGARPVESDAQRDRAEGRRVTAAKQDGNMHSGWSRVSGDARLARASERMREGMRNEDGLSSLIGRWVRVQRTSGKWLDVSPVSLLGLIGGRSGYPGWRHSEPC